MLALRSEHTCTLNFSTSTAGTETTLPRCEYHARNGCRGRKSGATWGRTFFAAWSE